MNKENRELDIWIAKQLGLIVFGYVWCQPDPSSYKNFYGFTNKKTDDEMVEEPVFLEQCLCTYVEKNIIEQKNNPEIQKILKGDYSYLEKEKIYGHYDSCLNVVPYYHNNKDWLLSILTKLEKNAKCSPFSELLCIELGGKYSYMDLLKAPNVDILKVIKEVYERCV